MKIDLYCDEQQKKPSGKKKIVPPLSKFKTSQQENDRKCCEIAQ